jgi:uncharacterized membrane protein YhaH (DUF805 family)
MPLSTMWFSLTGRLNRARFWLAGIVLGVVSLVLLSIPVLSWVFIATSPLSVAALLTGARCDPALPCRIAIKGWSAIPTASAGLLFAFFVYLCADLLVLFAGFAVSIKRLHDRDKSAWWLLLFYLVPAILQAIAYDSGAIEVRVILGLACFFIFICCLVELGFLRGTAGPNFYGPDRLYQGAGRAPGPRRDLRRSRC